MRDWKLLFDDLRSVFRWRLALLVALMVVVGLTEGASILLLLPLLTRIGLAGAATPRSGSADIVAALDTMFGPRVAPVVALIVAFAITSAILVLCQSWLLARMSQGYAARLKQRQLEAFFAARWPFFIDHKSGELLNSIVTEPLRLSSAASQMASLAAAAVIGSIYMGYALLISWKITALLVAAATCLMLVIRPLYARSRAIGQALGPLNAQQQVVAGEFLQAAKLVKAAAIEEIAISRAMAVVRALEVNLRTAVLVPAVVRAVFEGAGLIALVLLLVFATEYLATPPATLLVVLALFLRLFPRITNLQQYIHTINTFAPAVAIIRDLVRAAEKDAEPPSRKDAPQGEAVAVPSVIEVRGLVTEYDGRRILDGIDLTVAVPGFSVVVGPSGAGKSTLLGNFLGLVPRLHGTITVGDVPIETIGLRSWRRSIGFVPQETMLFHASIADNIRLLRPGATMEEVAAAARRAGLEQFVRELPEGFDTFIGDDGIRLSGGQRQRIGLARALLPQPKLLLLDEATSALDTATENSVLDSLGDLSKSIGILFITHRRNVALRADRVYVLDKGRIAALGQASEIVESASAIDEYFDRAARREDLCGT